MLGGIVDFCCEMVGGEVLRFFWCEVWVGEDRIG